MGFDRILIARLLFSLVTVGWGVLTVVADFNKTHATNPAWTPLFLHAVAVVVDTGGSASHAAIVAREYGVPAVMGTITGTQQLTDGQWIQVDGSRGLVLKGEKPE